MRRNLFQETTRKTISVNPQDSLRLSASFYLMKVDMTSDDLDIAELLLDELSDRRAD